MQRLATTIAGLTVAMLLGATALEAQGRGRSGDSVPKGYEPPRGMCRVWLDGVPAGQQPAPTDCATAIRRRPDNARVVFGEPARDGRDPRRDAIRNALRGDPSERESTPPAPTRNLRGQDREKEPRPDVRPPTRPETPPPASKGRRRAERPPDGDYDEQLMAEAALDWELLAALYGGPPGTSARDVLRTDDGRAAPRQRVGERGRQRVGAPVGPAERELAWAITAGGERLSAWEVERLLLEQRYDARYDALYGDGYGAGRDPRHDPRYDPRGDRLAERRLGAAISAERLAAAGEGPYSVGLVPARPGECWDRDFDGRCDDLAAGADGCFDRNRDGRCDDTRWDGPAGGYDAGRGVGRGDARSAAPGYGLCFDRDRDSRCDEPWSADRRIPQTLPEMAAAVGLRRGVASYDVERWLRRTDLQPRLTDRDGDGVPERVTWLDQAGRVVQLWTDRDGDGIADRVELFRDGLPVQVIGR